MPIPEEVMHLCALLACRDDLFRTSVQERNRLKTERAFSISHQIDYCEVDPLLGVTQTWKLSRWMFTKKNV
jgi:hypothetical protein